MPGLFSRLKSKDSSKKKKNGANNAGDSLSKPHWVDAWTRKTVEPEEVHELVRCCTEDLKARALNLPLFLLPFRPTSDPSAVRSFIRHFFDQTPMPHGGALMQELKMAEPMVISGVVKWCWSRIQGGVVGWDAYELFKVGEFDSNMARDSFNTFIPISVENRARQSIIFNFFDLMSAIAAHGKLNGFGGRKLSRMAAWWAFEQKDTGNGFEGGYNAWDSAADATSHLFFAYLRSLSPEKSTGGISMLPISLQKLVQETEYPPHKPDLMASKTNRVVMIVDNVSPTPFALLRRANHFQYRDTDPGLQEFSEFEDPIQALTEECRRVLKSVSAANQSQISSSKHSTSLKDASWSRFEDVGFSSALEEEEDDESAFAKPRHSWTQQLRTEPASGNGVDRPTTPSWADFLSSGFVDENSVRSNLLRPPPDKVLPPLDTQPRQHSSQSHRPRLESDRDLEPGELASITVFDLDDAFWWVWMSSLAPEETSERKAAFGRCAVVETTIRSDRWLVMEEIIAGAAPEPQEGAYIAERKGFFSWTRRGKTLNRTKSIGKPALNRGDKSASSATLGKSSIGPDTHAKIQAKAAQLRAAESQSRQESINPQRRGRHDIDLTKTNSVATLQSTLAGEVTTAMKWAKKYDKGAIKEAYLANNDAGRGTSLFSASTEQTIGTARPNGATFATAPEPKMEESQTEMPATPPQVAAPIPPRKPVMMPTTNPNSVVNQPPVPNHSSVLMKQRTEAEGEALTPPYTEAKPSVEQSPPPPPKSKHPSFAEAPEELSTSASLSTVPTHEAEKSKKLNKENKGFRKLFSRRNRTSKIPDEAETGINNLSREAQHTPEPPPVEQIPTPAATPDVAKSIVESSAVEGTERPEAEGLANALTPDSANSNQEFSRFDQGPLADQPAFTPQDTDEDDVVLSPTDHQSQHNSAANMKGLPAPPNEEQLSQSTSPGIQDRWAQIRKNAAERAAQREPVRTDEANRPPRAKFGDDDDDTSGEETIESRVARIKARVAELTGNMEGAAGGPPTPGSTSASYHYRVAEPISPPSSTRK